VNSRDRVPLILIVVLLLLAALAALLAPFVLADPGPAEPVPDTAEAPARPPVENRPAVSHDDGPRVRMVDALRGAAAVYGSPARMAGR
jgi:hypothetical protein